MDFLMPDDDTMEIMRQEFAKLKNSAVSHAFALAQDDDKNKDCADSAKPRQSDTGISAYIHTALLLLYFVKNMRYNKDYGTRIFDSDRGLGRFQSVRSDFGELNNLC